MFKSLYPDMTVIPKQHYMIHYPSQIEQHGPLIHCWTMRQEAKLSFIKGASRRGNFKNFCKTVTRKHQLWLCYQLQCEDHLLYQQPETNNNLTSTLLSSEPDHLQTELQRLDPNFASDCTVYHPKWLKLHNDKYKSGVFLLLERDDMPTFAKLVDIAVVENHILFTYQLYITEYLCHHYNAFVLKCRGSFVYVTPTSLVTACMWDK